MTAAKRSFDPIPLVLDEDEDSRIDQYAATQGIPDSRKAVATPPRQEAPAPAAPVAAPIVPRIDLRKVTFELPAYALRTLKQKALDEDVSIRLLIMRGLVREGIDIDPADLIEDGRRRPRG
jgi:hypothetical protein